MAPSPLKSLVRNVVGAVLIVGSAPLGMAVPGPNGFVMALIGFSILSFRGKRRMTARVLRGRGIGPRSRIPQYLALLLVVGIPASVASWLWVTGWWRPLVARAPWYVWLGWLGLLGGVAGLVALRSRHLLNWIVAKFPAIRRVARPWMKARGIELLPTRKREWDGTAGLKVEDEEILALNTGVGKRLRKWLGRLVPRMR